MTELQLYKFINDEDRLIDIDWRGEELIIWLWFSDLEDFSKMIGKSYFEDGGLNVNYLFNHVAFDLVPICEHFHIEPTNILQK